MANWFRSIRLWWLARRMGVRRREAARNMGPGKLLTCADDGSLRPAIEGDSVVGVYMGRDENGQHLVQFGRIE